MYCQLMGSNDKYPELEIGKTMPISWT